MRKPIYCDPDPVKLDQDTRAVVNQIVKDTGLTRSEVLRRAVRHSAPLFLSGAVSILSVGIPAAPGARKRA